MRIPLVVVVLGLTLASIGLAGCTSGTGGTPSPTTTTSSTSGDPASSGNLTKAPSVTHPLDASKMVAQPCTSLTAADLTGLHIVNAVSGSGSSPSSTTSCTWSGDSGGGVTIDWETANTNGLSDMYAKSSTIAYWQPTTVAGYPAAYGDAISDGRSQGNCVIDTAVTDHLDFFVQFDNPLNAGQSCALAAQAAAAVIKNLGGS
jgi:Protein of unknown function (DUF3558)